MTPAAAAGMSHSFTGSSGETFLSSIQRAAQVVVQAMRPAPEGPATPGLLLRAGTYQPAVTPTPGTPSAPLLGAGQAVGTRGEEDPELSLSKGQGLGDCLAEAVGRVLGVSLQGSTRDEG